MDQLLKPSVVQSINQSLSNNKRRVKALQGSSYFISLEEKDILGQGSFGKVVKVFDKDHPQEELVAKIIPIGDQAMQKSIQTELQILQKLKPHPNLVNYRKIKMSSNKKQYFIMDYCNQGTLTQMMKKNRNISESEIVIFLQQFCDGYKALYEQGIIHRDIKPDNILVHNRVYKIADFGLAKIIDSLQNNLQLSTRGTPLYMAPELYMRANNSNTKVDMWSLGVIVYKMLFDNRYPYLDPTVEYDINKIFRDIRANNLHIPSKPKRSDQIIKLCQQMLEKNPDKRISWEQLFDHEIIRIRIDQSMNGEETIGQILNNSMLSQKLQVMSVSKIRINKIVDDEDDLESSSEEKKEVIQKPKSEIEFEAASQQGVLDQIQQIFMKKREIIIFYDQVSFHLQKMNSLITEKPNLFSEFSIQSVQQAEIVVLIKAIQLSKDILNFHNYQHLLEQKNWSLFIQSDVYDMLYAQVRKDVDKFEGSLKKESSVYNDKYLKKIKELAQSSFDLEILLSIEAVLKNHSCFYFSQVNDKKQIVSTLLFLSELYNELQNKNEFQDKSEFTEIVFQNEADELHKIMCEKLQKLDLLVPLMFNF